MRKGNILFTLISTQSFLTFIKILISLSFNFQSFFSRLSSALTHFPFVNYWYEKIPSREFTFFFFGVKFSFSRALKTGRGEVGKQEAIFFSMWYFTFFFSSAAAIAILFHQMTTRWKYAKESASSCWANSLPSSMQNEFCLFFSGLGQGFRIEAVEEESVEGLKRAFLGFWDIVWIWSVKSLWECKEIWIMIQI